MDSSQSVSMPYTPICNNMSNYPSSMPFTITPAPPNYHTYHSVSVPSVPASTATVVPVAVPVAVPVPTPVPVPVTPQVIVKPPVASPPTPYVKPQVPSKPRIAPSQSVNSMPSKGKPPPLPMRRTANVGNCIGNKLDPHEAARRITECYRNFHVSPHSSFSLCEKLDLFGKTVVEMLLVVRRKRTEYGKNV